MTDKMPCPYANNHEDTREDRKNDACRHNDVGMARAVNFDHSFFDGLDQYKALRGTSSCKEENMVIINIK